MNTQKNKTKKDEKRSHDNIDDVIKQTNFMLESILNIFLGDDVEAGYRKEIRHTIVNRGVILFACEMHRILDSRLEDGYTCTKHGLWNELNDYVHNRFEDGKKLEKKYNSNLGSLD